MSTPGLLLFVFWGCWLCGWMPRPLGRPLGQALVVFLEVGAEGFVGDGLHAGFGVDGEAGGGSSALAEGHKDGFHPDRAEGDVAG